VEGRGKIVIRRGPRQTLDLNPRRIIQEYHMRIYGAKRGLVCASLDVPKHLKHNFTTLQICQDANSITNANAGSFLCLKLQQHAQ